MKCYTFISNPTPDKQGLQSSGRAICHLPKLKVAQWWWWRQACYSLLKGPCRFSASRTLAHSLPFPVIDMLRGLLAHLCPNRLILLFFISSPLTHLNNWQSQVYLFCPFSWFCVGVFSADIQHFELWLNYTDGCINYREFNKEIHLRAHWITANDALMGRKH